MGVNGLRQVALVGVVPLLLIACAVAGNGGQGGGSGGAGTSGSGGATGGSAGSTGGGTVTDGGPDLPVLTCHADNDCPSGSYCIPPGVELCPRTCTTIANPCTTDSDCAPDAAIPIVCLEDGCACNSAKRCMTGCRGTADCPVASFCYSDHHCGQLDCDQQSPNCPTNYSCQDLNTGTYVCLSTRCTTDSECSGACVTGSCYPALGTCQVLGP